MKKVLWWSIFMFILAPGASSKGLASGFGIDQFMFADSIHADSVQVVFGVTFEDLGSGGYPSGCNSPYKSLYLGVNVAATKGVDTGLGEIEAPPPPPTGNFDLRVRPPGPYYYMWVRDFRPFTSITQIDTYR